jgi:hypothetical protein
VGVREIRWEEEKAGGCDRHKNDKESDSDDEKLL